MKKLIVIAGLLLVQVAFAQNTVRDTTKIKEKNWIIIKPEYTKKEKRQHAIFSGGIISVFFIYMFVILIPSNK